MRAILLVCMALVGCRAAPPVSLTERGAFAFVAAGDTTVVESYTRTAGWLVGELSMRSPSREGVPARVRYRVRYDAAGRADRAELSIWRPGVPPDSAPSGRWVAALGEEEVVEEGPGAATRRVRVDTEAVPLFGPSIAMLEGIVRRARRLTGGRTDARVPVFHLATSGQVEIATVRWIGGDSVAVALTGNELRYAIDPQGRILGGSGGEDAAQETVRLRQEIRIDDQRVRSIP